MNAVLKKHSQWHFKSIFNEVSTCKIHLEDEGKRTLAGGATCDEAQSPSFVLRLFSTSDVLKRSNNIQTIVDSTNVYLFSEVVLVIYDQKCNQTFRSSHRGKCSGLVLLELTSVFDAVDNHIVIKRLCNGLGRPGSALDCFYSSLTEASPSLLDTLRLINLHCLVVSCKAQLWGLCYSPYI